MTLVATFVTICAMAVGAGAMYGCFLSKYALIPPMVLSEVRARVLEPKQSNRIAYLRYVVACWPDHNFPHLIVELKNPTKTFIVRRPGLSNVQMLLSLARNHGIDFGLKVHDYTGPLGEPLTYEYELIKNGVPTDEFGIRLDLGYVEERQSSMNCLSENAK